MALLPTTASFYDKVKITGNTIIQDPSFRLNVDDDLGKYYHMYSGIQVQTNTQYKDLHSADKGYFDISNNVIKKSDGLSKQYSDLRD